MINKLEETKDTILRQLHNVKVIKQGTSYIAKCPNPNHKDNTPSLGITITDNKILMNCFGCGSNGMDLISSGALQGIKVQDLFKEDDYKPISYNLYFRDETKVLRTHTYRYENGNVAYMVDKVVSGDKKLFYAYFKDSNGDLRYLKRDYGLILYNLKEVIKAKNNGDTIYLTEGEKDADTLINLGLTATTNVWGANKINDFNLYYKNILKDTNLVLFADNDFAGKTRVKELIDLLSRDLKSLKVIELDSNIKGYDITDYVEDTGAEKKDIIQLTHKAENIPTGKYRNLYNYYSYNDYIPNIDKNKQKYEFTTDKGKVNTNQNRVLEYLTTHIPLITVNNQHYLYEKGVYKSVTRNHINMIVQDHLVGDYKTNTLRNGIASLWINDRSVMKNPEQINNMVDLMDNKLLLNLKNGIYNVLTKELRPHNYKDYSTIQIKANYNPNLNNSNGLIFNKFLNEVAPDPDTQILLQEILGYSISPLNNAKKSFILYGESNTGKSIFLGLITGLLGQENISAVPFQQLDSTFSTASLYGKTVNVCADLPKGAIQDDSVFKQLTGGDIMKAEFKGQDEFEFVNTAKLIFSTNSLPENYGDEGNAFYNRLIIIPFNQVISEEKQDKTLNLKLHQELDYIFMWGLKGLERLIQNDMKFSISQESKELLENYKVSKTDNTIELIKDLIDRNYLVEHTHYKYINNKTELALYTTGVYEVIINYSNSYLSKDDKKGIHMSKKDFQESLRKENYFLDYKPVNMSGKSKRCYVVKNYELEVISN